MNQTEFDKLYAALQPDIAAVEAYRRRLLTMFLVQLAPGLVIGYPVMHSLWKDRLLLALIMVAAMFVAGYAVLYFHTSQKLAGHFKNRLFSQIICFISPGMYYNPDGFIHRQKLNKSFLFPFEVRTYVGEDYCKGYHQDTLIEFSEVYAHDKPGTPKLGKYYRTFSGIFFIADFNKKFSARTIVLPDKTEGRLGAGLADAMRSKRHHSAELTRLEDPAFEERFAVYTDDEIEARYILSPSMMARMTALRDSRRAPVYFSFVNSAVHVGLVNRRPVFEISLYRPLRVKEQVKKLYDDFKRLYEIVEDLNLNTRIWSKASGVYCPNCKVVRMPLTEYCPQCGDLLPKG